MNLTASSGENGFRDEESGSGFFSLSVTGLESGTYSFSLGASGQSVVSQEVPAPATLLLLGAGLLAGAGTYRRRRAA
ncbi:MAG: PEP-CTERM sorting domain-containing protein [Halioglobus sp.]|nr:PEP-CTERM sorting domain-containing protein [Halioglobus sp.]